MTSLASQIYPFNRWLLRIASLSAHFSPPQIRLFIDYLRVTLGLASPTSTFVAFPWGGVKRSFFTCFSFSPSFSRNIRLRAYFLDLSGIAHSSSGLPYLPSVCLLLDIKSRRKSNQPTIPASPPYGQRLGCLTEKRSLVWIVDGEARRINGRGDFSPLPTYCFGSFVSLSNVPYVDMCR